MSLISGILPERVRIEFVVSIKKPSTKYVFVEGKFKVQIQLVNY